MPLEVATHIASLVATNPAGVDDLSTADDHLRLIKDVLIRDLPLTTAATAVGISVLTAATANAGADALGAFRQGTLLGVVSQTSGIPTGAVIQRSSNANGDFVKFADGTLICNRTVLANATLTPGQFVQTVAFAVTPVGDFVVTGTCYLYAAAAQSGNNLYSVPFSYTPDSIVFMNTGVSPQIAAPSFTLGSTNALSYKLTQQLVGRWF